MRTRLSSSGHVIRKGPFVRERSTLQVDGPIASLSLRIEGELSSRQRRAIAVSLVSHLESWLNCFRRQYLRHHNHQLPNFDELERRGVPTFGFGRLETPTGKRGFEIRMRRLQLGLTQEALAARAEITSRQLGRIERGLCVMRPETLTRLEAVLGMNTSS